MAAPATSRKARAASPSSAARPAAGEPAPELTALGQAFRRVFRAVSSMRGRDTHLGEGELSHAQFELLIELEERGELPAGELATAARMAPASVTRMLDHLAACGHVQRIRSPHDGRVVVSRLTPRGRRAITAKRSIWKRRWEQALGELPARELRAATAVLERLGAMLEEAPPSAGRAGAACAPPPGRKTALR
jgi:DNA-binding MarR family transcriptional regulator